MFPPAVVIHGRIHARTALRPGRPVCLLSAAGAGRTAGAGWWRALVAAALAETPSAPGTLDILDCGDAPGAAMAALRLGQAHLILHPDCPAFAAVAGAAASLGAVLLARRPASLDLGRRHAERALASWLSAAPCATRQG